MTIEEAKAVIYGNVVYACEKAGFSPYTTKLVQDACDMIIAIADRKDESNSEKPNNCEPKICDTCRYYNSNIPCGSTPSACKEADKLAKEFVDGLKKLKPKVEPTISKMEQVEEEPKTQTKTQNSNLTFEKTDEPQKDCKKCKNYDRCKNNRWKCCVYEPKDEPQTDCAWK